ncbi:hypothetical protein BXU09_19120 [Deinococcus sp. LM3]|nr:hypothetical protein BXU09_19120 [Deinococcus sp. LM3]
MHAGADLVSTALSGYTPDSPQQEAPDFELMQGLHAAGIPFPGRRAPENSCRRRARPGTRRARGRRGVRHHPARRRHPLVHGGPADAAGQVATR